MKLFNKIALLTMLIITCMVGSPSSLYSQNETGTRNLNDTLYKATHSWYDSTTAMFQHQFPIIRSIPPLNTSMPLDVLISYIYLDSLLRSPLASTIEQKLESWTTLNDTLTYAAKALFILKDYNPIILKQYANEVQLHSGSDSGFTMKFGSQEFTSQYEPAKYKAYLHNLIYSVSDKIYNILKSDTNTAALAKAYFATLYADYILRVKVIAIDSTPNKLNSTHNLRYNVIAQVLDTIVGKAIPSLPNNPQNLLLRHAKKTTLNDTSSHFTTFEYIQDTYFTKTPFHDGITSGWVEDSAFLVSNSDVGFKLHPGQEAIVFLTFDNPLFDKQNDYFNLDVRCNLSYNALPIIGGDVRDINMIWSSQVLLSYDQWLTKINTIISKIKNRNY